MNKQFYKYQGTGNDFILFEDYESLFPTTPELISKLCNRNLGIGADGILLLQNSHVADVKMRIFNQDGSEASMCGNGLRCVCRHIGKSCTIETLGGISNAEYGTHLIKVSLPKSQVLRSSIILSNNLIGHHVDTGTPHLVIFTDYLDEEKLAKDLRYEPMFEPSGINVNLAKITPEGIRVRTFEKGVEEETLSCGSGGAAVALIHQKDVRIFFTSFELFFSFDSNNKIWMEASAEFVFQGHIPQEF